MALLFLRGSMVALLFLRGLDDGPSLSEGV